ncbi:hypothetical protein G7Y89_g2509 [Cudoniella acicularis]|uniref:N-acetyltransferase domain-containing protein n=1 Tax=Cudoniella acicularis TaxID=354080 RepID=A0A8H4RUD1_9HELO|nr:hypothetical protein G7Y89_g2509 [Cudoniella acicularis]
MESLSNHATPWSEEELRAKVGQLFIVGFHGHVPSEDIKTLITTHKIGTVILFQRNVQSETQLLSLTNSLQEIAKSAGHSQDLFIAIDQENGLITRIKSPIAAQLPGSMALGATKDTSNAYKVALATAETLKKFGINMNYAPIADVNSEPKNPVIGVRSVSDDPEAVGRFVSGQIKGLREGGIVPCVKHFPGHGDTAVDSHYGLPVISKSKAMINACELIPFRRATAENVDAVMTAHIVMSGIEGPSMDHNEESKKLPASLNPSAIQILRNEMQYKGLIISDCLEMDGVRAPYGTEKAAVMALKAGTDCVMICHTMAAQVGAIELVLKAVKSGELFQQAIQASVDRISRLKSQYLSTAEKFILASTLENSESRRNWGLTSNDPWAPPESEMSEVAQRSKISSNDFYEIMDMLDKQLNDKDKKWRNALRALKILAYCLREGSELFVTWTRKNIYIIKALGEFQYIDQDGQDVGQNVRVTAKELTSLILDEDRLRNERSDNKKHFQLASEIYAKSTTVVRSEPGIFPLPSSPGSKIVFVSPGKTAAGGGAVEGGEKQTREPYTPATYLDLLRVHNQAIVEIRFFDGVPLTYESEKALKDSEFVVLATRNASLSPYQKELGLLLGKKLGRKLIVISTCDPYDFLEEIEEIKNYIAIYEPTIPAFRSAVDVIFGNIKPSGSLPVGIVTPKHHIRPFTGTTEDIDGIWAMWQEIFPKWRIEKQRLEKFLSRGTHLLHKDGFCMTYIVEPSHGMIAIIGVLAPSRGKGIGTALVKRARAELRAEAIANGSRDLLCLGIGSVFPRLWPGVPIDFPQETKDFFLHRGFRKSTKPTARDLYRDITKDVAPPDIVERISKLPLKFAPWSPDMYAECMTKQRANFKNIGWVKAYEDLAKANQHHEVMVAFDEDGAQVGWTLMCSPSALVSNIFAFLPLMPSGPNTGLIACVGVDEHARRKGVGLALLVKAMENMKERGIAGVCIDWVVIRGFYEKLGFEMAAMNDTGRNQTTIIQPWNVAVVGVAFALTGVSFLIIISRTILRRLKHEEYLLDDFVMLASVVLYAVYTAVFPIAVNDCQNLWHRHHADALQYYNGTNFAAIDPGELSPHQIQRGIHPPHYLLEGHLLIAATVMLGSQFILVGRPFFLSYIWSTKACILIFYTRITDRMIELMIIKAAGISVAITWLACMVSIFLECNPLSLEWQVLPQVPECAVASTLVMASVVAVIITRIVTVARVDSDPAHWQPNLLIWGQVECFLMTAVANAPILYRLWRHGFNHIRKTQFGMDACSTGYTPPVENQVPRAESRGKAASMRMKTFGRGLRSSMAKMQDAVRRSGEGFQIERRVELLQHTKTITMNNSTTQSESPEIWGGTAGPLTHISTTISRTGALAVEIDKRQQFANKFKALRQNRTTNDSNA